MELKRLIELMGELLDNLQEWDTARAELGQARPLDDAESMRLLVTGFTGNMGLFMRAAEFNGATARLKDVETKIGELAKKLKQESQG
jgi:hypothetical protein